VPKVTLAIVALLILAGIMGYWPPMWSWVIVVFCTITLVAFVVATVRQNEVHEKVYDDGVEDDVS
jgi:Flp pilus assembly protein TadB